MTIPKKEYDYYAPFIDWLRQNVGNVPRTLPGGDSYACDLQDVRLILVPQQVVLGRGNTAIYIGSYHKPMQVTVFQRAVAEHQQNNPFGPNDVVQQKTYLVHTKGKSAQDLADLPAETRIQDFAITWHEYGHGVLDRLRATSSEDNAYVVELDVLGYALSTGVLHEWGLRDSLAGYLAGRVDQYRLGTKTRGLIAAALDSIASELIKQRAHSGRTSETFEEIKKKLTFDK
jgi:hypothetical protein